MLEEQQEVQFRQSTKGLLRKRGGEMRNGRTDFLKLAPNPLAKPRLKAHNRSSQPDRRAKILSRMENK